MLVNRFLIFLFESLLSLKSQTSINMRMIWGYGGRIGNISLIRQTMEIGMDLIVD